MRRVRRGAGPACARLIGGLLVGLALLASGCASKPAGTRPAAVSIRPAPQQIPSSQVVGEAIVASFHGASVAVRWLDAQAFAHYYASKPGLTVPLSEEIWKDTTPMAFWLRIHNLTRDEVQFDPELVSLVAQDGRRERPIPYEEFYMRLTAGEDSEARLRSLQVTQLSRFMVIAPGAQREGILLFPAVGPEAKLLNLELGSFFVGGRSTSGLFQFQVVR
jgi:hypothetical protein